MSMRVAADLLSRLYESLRWAMTRFQRESISLPAPEMGYDDASCR